MIPEIIGRFLKPRKEDRALLIVDCPNVADNSYVVRAYSELKKMGAHQVHTYGFIPKAVTLEWEAIQSYWESTSCLEHLKVIPSYSPSKVSRSDMYVGLYAARLMMKQKYRWIGIMSSDTDFFHLARYSQEVGVTPVAFVAYESCNRTVTRIFPHVFVESDGFYERREHSLVPKPKKKKRNKLINKFVVS